MKIVPIWTFVTEKIIQDVVTEILEMIDDKELKKKIKDKYRYNLRKKNLARTKIIYNPDYLNEIEKTYGIKNLSEEIEDD